MGKARFVVSVLSAIAFFAVVASLADAGGGMGQGTGASVCRLILSGAPNQPQTVRVGDFFLGSNTDEVKVGAAVLLCDLDVSNGFTVAGPRTGTPISPSTSVTCYTLSGADPARIQATMKDPFTEVFPGGNGSQAVQIGAIQLLCVPSAITDIHQ
jgi:hypothetical protein